MSPSNGPIGCFSKATKDSDVKLEHHKNIHQNKHRESFVKKIALLLAAMGSSFTSGKASKCHGLWYRILKQPKTYQVGDLHPIISHSYGHILVITGDKLDFSSCHKRGFFVL
jgi:hypothetical protein